MTCWRSSLPCAPRRARGKHLHFLAPGVETVLFPFARITFVEFMPNTKDQDTVIDFFRLD
jgi:hypothetical protein